MTKRNKSNCTEHRGGDLNTCKQSITSLSAHTTWEKHWIKVFKVMDQVQIKGFMLLYC